MATVSCERFEHMPPWPDRRRISEPDRLPPASAVMCGRQGRAVSGRHPPMTLPALAEASAMVAAAEWIRLSEGAPGLVVRVHPVGRDGPR